ncbi:MAG: hypothetical protein ABS79_01925 [Planctomycetes bacterium SCN 63-9]|nr:MAG: hypothetical protein ABS79_01925 [Planctomycetes bacterium SCN 63-9]
MELPTLDSLQAAQRQLRAQLAQLRRRLRLQLFLEFAAEASILLVATATLLIFLDWLVRPERPARFALLVVCFLGLLVFLGFRAARLIKSAQLDELALAVTLDRYRPGVGQQVADVLQLPGLLDEPRTTASPAMVRWAVQRASEALAASDWRSLWNRKRTLLYGGSLALAVLAPLLFALAAPNIARLSVARWLYGSPERWPQQTYLTVMGLNSRGRLLAPRDEPFQIEVRTDLPLIEQRGNRWIVGGRDEPLALRLKPEHPKKPSSVRVFERSVKGATRASTMTEADPVRFRHEFPPSPDSSAFELTGGDDWLNPIMIDRVDRPSLAETRLRVKEPGASYAGFRAIEDPRQHLLFLPDTELELTLVGSESLAGIDLKIHPGVPPKVERVDSRTFVARWSLKEASTLEILLTSSETGLESRPTFLSVGLLRDREPRVTLRAVGVGGHVTPVATIPLSIAATDDFGLGALRLQVEKTLHVEEKEKVEAKIQKATVPLPLPGDFATHPLLDHQTRHEISLQADPPKVGTLIRFVAEADDRCGRGSQTGRSGAITIQVVSPDELFYELLIRQRAERSKFLAVLEATEKNAPVMAGKPTVDELIRVMRTEGSGARQLDQIAGRVADTLLEMQLNQIGSPKSHRLLREGVVDPMRALTAGPLNQLRSMLQSLTGGGQIADASRESARRLHEEVVTKMKNILEQMSQWESFVDVVNQVAELIRMEKKVLQQTEKAQESRTQEVFDDKPQ